MKGKVEVMETLPTIPTNVELKMMKVEDVTTQTSKYRGLRIEVEDKDGNKYAEMLWYQQTLSVGTKLGAVCYAFHGKKFLEDGEYDTDLWLNKWFKWIKKARGNNLVEVIATPKTDVRTPTID